MKITQDEKIKFAEQMLDRCEKNVKNREARIAQYGQTERLVTELDAAYGSRRIWRSITDALRDGDEEIPVPGLE